MSKTFKSAWPNHPRRINIREIEDGVNVRISDPQWEDKKGITLAPSDIPAIMLALGEAAGLTVAKDDFKEGSVEDLLIDAALHLKGAIKLQERATAEAEAQAKLEAEALELYKTYWSGNVTGFSNEPNRDDWINVARRARELNKENQ